MSVRSYSLGTFTPTGEGNKNAKRGPINRDNNKKTATEGSKTQKRKANLERHKQSTRGMK